MRLTLRTLLAYLDDTLPGDEARLIGQKVSESPAAQELIEKIRRVTRRRGLSTPPNAGGDGSDPNTVAEYLSDALKPNALTEFENLCLDSDVHLAEIAACHQILTLLLSEPVRVPPVARQRMYRLVTGPESLPNKKPGTTAPVGGIMPDDPLPGSDDAERAYLLGLKAYTRTESRSQRVGQIVLLSGLIIGLALTTIAAWPTARTAQLPSRQNTVAFVAPNPIPPTEEKQKPDNGEPIPIQVENPMPPAREPVFTEPEVVAPPPLVNNLPKIDGNEKEEPPINDAMSIARFELEDRVLLAERDQKWVRIMPLMPDVATGERLIALPGFQIPLELTSGAKIELWGNLPELKPLPLLESSVTFHVPYDGFHADLTIHSGRIYLSSGKPTGSKIRVRYGKQIWNVTIPDDKTELVVELTKRVIPGMTFDVNPAELPLTDLKLLVLKGQAKFQTENKSLPELKVNDCMEWTNKGAGLRGPIRLTAVERYGRTTLTLNENVQRAIQSTLAEFTDSLKEMNSIRVRLAEFFEVREPGLNETQIETNRRLIKPGLAVLGYAAIEEMSPLIDGLVDESRARVRDASVFALQLYAAENPENIEAIAKAVMNKSRLTEEQAKSIVRLIRGLSPQERGDGKALDQLVEYLNSPVLAIRELAFWQLLNEVDPEARTIKTLNSFDAAGPPLARESSANSWKRRIEDLKRKGP